MVLLPVACLETVCDCDSLSGMQPLQFDTGSPSPHLVIDDFAPLPVIRAAAKTWPDERWSWWHKYDDVSGLHTDAEIHPLTGWTRLLNAVLFIEGDGILHLGRRGEDQVEINPVPGRLVVFSTQQAWHGVSSTSVIRKSLAVYWWADRQEQGGAERAVFA